MNDRAKFDGDSLLAAAIRSDQASAAQVHQHVQAGELPITPQAAAFARHQHEGDFTVVMNDKHARLLHLADIGATVLIEAYARRLCIRDARPVYDITTPDLDELPDNTTLESAQRDLAMAAAHLAERGVLVRPVEGDARFVSIREL